MKALILVSSIFYLLGVKISHHIDLFKRSSKNEEIRAHEIAPSKKLNTIDYKEAQSITAQPETAHTNELNSEKDKEAE